MSASPSTNGAAAAAAVDAAPIDIDSFLRDMTTLEREQEVHRITSTAFKLNPFDLLNVDHTATRDVINKAYRSSSLQVHPDKFPSGPEREKAQIAFTMLAAAKEELLDDAKREALDTIVDQARQKVLTDKAAEGRKKRKTSQGADAASAPPNQSNEADEDDDASKHPHFDLWVRNEVKEILIEREWRKRQLLKAAAAEDALAASEKARRAAEREQKDKDAKEWEEGRETRINSWRDFQTKGKKGPMRGMKPPKMHKEDADSTYIRRPVAHQSSDK